MSAVGITGARSIFPRERARDAHKCCLRRQMIRSACLRSRTIETRSVLRWRVKSSYRLWNTVGRFIWCARNSGANVILTDPLTRRQLMTGRWSGTSEVYRPARPVGDSHESGGNTVMDPSSEFTYKVIKGLISLSWAIPLI